MTKFGMIDFDDCIIDALRNDQLVVFAGSGVSIGGLPSVPISCCEFEESDVVFCTLNLQRQITRV